MGDQPSILPSVEQLDPLIGGALAFVGKVVGGAREPVDRDDRAALARRHEERGDGEVLVMTDRHGFALGRRRRPTTGPGVRVRL